MAGIKSVSGGVQRARDTAAKTAATAAKKRVSMNVSRTIKAKHPGSGIMVVEAIERLNDRRGSSLRAIKNYINGVYLVDMKRLSHYITRYVLKAVDEGTLVRIKGKGAAGSFRLGGGASSTSKAKKVAANVAEKSVKTVGPPTSTIENAAKSSRRKVAPKRTTAAERNSTLESEKLATTNAAPTGAANRTRNSTKNRPVEISATTNTSKRVPDKMSIKKLTKSSNSKNPLITHKLPAKSDQLTKNTTSSNTTKNVVAKRRAAKE